MPFKILVKYPSRGRPDRFFKSLDSFYNNVQDTNNFLVSCTLDEDDPTMNNPEVIERIMLYPNIEIRWGLSESKVNAINRDLPEYGDIVLVHSDDMLFTFYGFDTLIRNVFKERGLDLLLHIPDQDAQGDLATMYIAGRIYYNRFGYVYHPSYKSLFCDNEVQNVAIKLGKYHFENVPCVIEHLNPAYGHQPKDEMFEQQQAIGYTIDHKNYYLRESKNFDL